MDWKRIKAEYIAGGTSYRKLCDKYGVPRTTLERKAKDEKWTELRRRAEGKAEAKIVDAVSGKEADRVNRIISVADKLLDKISEMIDYVDNPTGIKDISTAIKNIKDIKGFKSDADMREQEARIAKLQKESASEETDNEIKVVIEGDLELYSK